MLVEGSPCETRVALVEQGRLAEIHYETRDREQIVGNIYKGRVSRVVAGIAAAFVDIGIDRDAYLYTGGEEDQRAKELAAEGRPTDGPGADAAVRGEDPERRTVREVQPVAGREIIVQVVKEALESKGARVTSRISLAGRFLVLLPGGGQLGLSRRIEDPAERQRLHDTLAGERDEGVGLIVRTAAAGIEPQRLTAEYRELLERWEAVRRLADRSGAPALLMAEEELAERLTRDLLSDEFDEIVVEGEAQHRRLLRFVEAMAPELASKLRRHESSEALFDRFGVDEQIERALRSRVWLKSGGSIVIHQTEALVAIDVNTGRYVGKASLEETVVKTNLEAVEEVVRQIRLRDLSGIVVIDFIDMIELRNQELVMEALERELVKDRSRSRVLRISEFGLVELTRKRSRSNLQSLLTRKCPRCDGSGRVASRAAICGRLRRDLMRYRLERAGGAMVVQAHPSIVEALNGPQKALLEAMRESCGGALEIESCSALSPEEYRLESRVGAAGGSAADGREIG